MTKELLIYWMKWYLEYDELPEKTLELIDDYIYRKSIKNSTSNEVLTLSNNEGKEKKCECEYPQGREVNVFNHQICTRCGLPV